MKRRKKQILHDLRKSQKGLRRQSRKIKKLKRLLAQSENDQFQYYMAMAYMAGEIKIEPYRGWDPETQYWIDKYEEKEKKWKKKKGR